MVDQITVTFRAGKPPVATNEAGKRVPLPGVARHFWITGHRELAFTKYEEPHCAECGWRSSDG